METLILDPSRGMYVDVEYLADLVNDRADVIRYNSRDQQEFQEELLEKFGHILKDDESNKKEIKANYLKFLDNAKDLFNQKYK